MATELTKAQVWQHHGFLPFKSFLCYSAPFPSVHRNLKPSAPFSPLQEKLGRVVQLLEGLKSSAPHLSGELDKVLCHVADVRA